MSFVSILKCLPFLFITDNFVRYVAKSLPCYVKYKMNEGVFFSSRRDC